MDSASSRKSFSFQIMGVELPLPEILTFHLIFWVALHWMGGLQLVTVPSALGPRQVGYWLAACRLGFKKKRPGIMNSKIRMRGMANRIPDRPQGNSFFQEITGFLFQRRKGVSRP